MSLEAEQKESVLGVEATFFRMPSLCGSRFEFSKSELAWAECWEAEMKPPGSEQPCGLEAMRGRRTGAGGFQFLLALSLCVSSAPFPLPALQTNSGPQAHYQTLLANSPRCSLKEADSCTKVPTRFYLSSWTCLASRLGSGLLSDCSLILKQPFLDLLCSSFLSQLCKSPSLY